MFSAMLPKFETEWVSTCSASIAVAAGGRYRGCGLRILHRDALHRAVHGVEGRVEVCSYPLMVLRFRWQHALPHTSLFASSPGASVKDMNHDMHHEFLLSIIAHRPCIPATDQDIGLDTCRQPAACTLLHEDTQRHLMSCGVRQKTRKTQNMLWIREQQWCCCCPMF